MSTEVLKGTLDMRSKLPERKVIVHHDTSPSVHKKVFRIESFDHFKIPKISLKAIHIPKQNRVIF